MSSGTHYMPSATESFLFIWTFLFSPCHMAYGILVPQWGIEPAPSAVKAWSPDHWTAREFPMWTYLVSNQLCEEADTTIPIFLIYFLTCTHCYIYLLLAVPGLRCYTQAFSSCGEQGLLPSCGAVASLVAESRLQGQGLQQLQHMGSAVVTCGLEGTWAQYLWLLGSVVVAHGLSCSAVYGIFPDQGSNPLSPVLSGRFLSAMPPGKSPIFVNIWRYRCKSCRVCR